MPDDRSRSRNTNQRRSSSVESRRQRYASYDAQQYSDQPRRRSSTQGSRSQQAPSQQARPQRDQYARTQHPERSSRPQAERGDYARGGYVARKKKSKLPFIIAGIAVVVVILIVVLALRGCGGGENADTQDASSDANNIYTTEATPLEEGRIVMTLGGDADTIVLLGEDYIESGCHAIDKQEGNITTNVQITGDVDTSTAGDYTVTYTVRNSENMEATKTRTVHVVESMEADTDGISVMMYHYVYDDANPPEDLNNNYIPASKFEQHLQYLVENDYYFPSYQELSAYIAGTHSLPAKSVVLTFDDGELGFLDYGKPLLEKYQVPATSFIICIDPDASERITNYASEYITFQSHTYGCHMAGTSGLGHGGKIFDLTEDELVEDFQTAQSILGTSEAVAYPYGDVSDVADAACARAGILCAFTTNYGQVHVGDDPYQLSRMRVFGDYDVSSFYAQV